MAAHVSLAAGTYIFGKQAAVAFGNPAALTMARALGAALLLLALSRWTVPRPRFSRRQWMALAGLGTLLVPVNQYCFLKGLQHTVPSHPALLYALTPLGVLLASSLLQRRLPPRGRMLGVLAALLGVTILLRPWQQGTSAQELRAGDLWIVCSLVSWVLYTVAASRLCQDHDPRAVTSWSLVLGALIMAPWGGPDLAVVDLARIPPSGWISLAWLILITSVLLMQLWNRLLRHLEPELVAICTNAQPPVTALLAALLAHLGLLDAEQDLGPLFWLGSALILAGTWLVQRTGLRVPAAAALPRH